MLLLWEFHVSYDTSDILITGTLLARLKHIKSVFEKHRTHYVVIITQAYCYINPCIHPADLCTLQSVFGGENVFNYTGENSLTTDCYNFSDLNHFSLYVGWHIIEEIYGKVGQDKWI